MSNVRLEHDAETDAAYLYLQAPAEVAVTVPGEDEAEGVNLDFSADGKLLGIEILDASKRLPAEILAHAKKRE